MEKFEAKMGENDKESEALGSCPIIKPSIEKKHDTESPIAKCSGKSDFLEGKAVKLLIEILKKLVAYGTMFIAGAILHGRQMPADCLHVSIDEAVDEDALLPHRISDDRETVGSALGTHVAWSSHLVVERSNENLLPEAASLHIFDRHLYREMNENNTLAKFLFVNPFAVAHGVKDEDRARALLSERLLAAASNQIILVPCNVGAMSIVNVNKGKKFKKLTWEIIKGPMQPDDKQCGYYVMRFMRQIIKGFENEAPTSLSSLFNGGSKYSQKELDQVREEWATCVIKHAW